MDENLVKLEIYDKREKSISTMYVEQISRSKFRMVDNDVLNCRLVLGTEFETRVNKDGLHEIIRITKESDFITRRFMLNSQFQESDYRFLGDEIVKHGAFWQVDFGSIATVNIPRQSTLNLDEIFRIFDFHPTEFTKDD